MKKEKFTIKQFSQKYRNDDICLDEIFLNRFGHLENCPSCESKFSFHKVSDRKCYACAYCSHQIHPLAKTIFHKSSTSLRNWFFAIFLFAASKNGVSAKELQRQLGVTYKCAHRMAKQIRKLFEEDQDNQKLKNEVEVDETYYGGKEANKHAHKKTPNTQGRSIKKKIPVLAAVEREGKIIAKVVGNTKSSTIQPFLKQHVCINAEIKTDEYRGYSNLKKLGYNHDTVDHGRKQFVKDRVTPIT